MEMYVGIPRLSLTRPGFSDARGSGRNHNRRNGRLGISFMVYLLGSIVHCWASNRCSAPESRSTVPAIQARQMAIASHVPVPASVRFSLCYGASSRRYGRVFLERGASSVKALLTCQTLHSKQPANGADAIPRESTRLLPEEPIEPVEPLPSGHGFRELIAIKAVRKVLISISRKSLEPAPANLQYLPSPRCHSTRALYFSPTLQQPLAASRCPLRVSQCVFR